MLDDRQQQLDRALADLDARRLKAFPRSESLAALQPAEKIANHAWYTFWYVVPTLPMFLAFPLLLPRLGFWLTMLASIAITVACFALFAWMVKPLGIQLLP